MQGYDRTVDRASNANIKTLATAVRSPFVAATETFTATHELAIRITTLAERLGCGGADASGVGVAPEPYGLFQLLEDRADRAASVIRDAHEALDRIEARLP